MVPIPVRDDLLRSVEKLAEAQGTDAETLVNNWIEQQLALAREQGIRAEAERFRAQHAALLAAYAGEYVAMRQGEVVDHDRDGAALYRRVRARFGNEPVLVAPVTTSPTPTYHLRSPRFAGPSA
jgi:hypothetical protein